MAIRTYKLCGSQSDAMSTNPAHYVNPDEVMAAGRRKMQTLALRFYRQATQPKWLKCSQALYKEEKWHLHSSQIGGFSYGKLKDPSPKSLYVMGQLNLSLAASLTDANDNPRYPQVTGVPKLPQDLKRFWGSWEPMVDAQGNVLGPIELFRVMIDDIDLGFDEERVIPMEAEEAVSKTLAVHVRLALAKKGVDFFSAMEQLRTVCPTMEPLLMGKVIPGDQLVRDLQAISDAIGETDADLWVLCLDHINQAQ